MSPGYGRFPGSPVARLKRGSPGGIQREITTMPAQPGDLPLECRALRSALDDFFHGHLSAEERAELEAHAAGCASCSRAMRIRDELSCQEFVAFLDAYVEGELSPARREVFESHLATCPDCRNYLDSYRKTMELGREALSEPDEVSIPADLIQAILLARKSP